MHVTMSRREEVASFRLDGDSVFVPLRAEPLLSQNPLDNRLDVLPTDASVDNPDGEFVQLDPTWEPFPYIRTSSATFACGSKPWFTLL